MKKYFLLLNVLLLIVSCKDQYNPGDGVILTFAPRKVSYLSLAPLRQVTRYVPGINGDGYQYLDYEGLQGNAVSKEVFCLNAFTSNCYPPSFIENPNLYFTILDEPIPEIERQIGQDYHKYLERKQSSTKKSGEVAMNLETIEYRTTPIKRLIISTLNTPLFGKPAGESLNDFFDIIKYDPPVIVSYPSNDLVYGYTSKVRLKAIDEWLSLYPYAHVDMTFAPNKPISGLPVDVQFVIRIETNEGMILSDTTQLFKITE